MALSILYCGECDVILAASPELNLIAECLAHTIGGVTHRGYHALRLPGAVAVPSDFADLTVLVSKYPKVDFAAQLEPLAGDCP